MSTTETLLERSLIPDALVREGIRRRCARRALDLRAGSIEDCDRRERAMIESLRRSPIAIHVDRANDQHYEMPPEFLEACLGPRMKYSSGYWPEGVTTLEEAELRMLDLYVERAQLQDGQDVLELGCGWGSLTLHLAEQMASSRIVGVSNSAAQRDWILHRARERRLDNIEIVTADINDFEAPGRFDRVVSIEMFEHMKNYQQLLRRISSWLQPGGKLFLHMFTHREWSYHYEIESDRDWMARHFFTGGTMAAHDLLRHFDRDLVIEEDWRLSGAHYQKTAEAWLANLDARRQHVWPILETVYGRGEALRWWNRWRVFYLACAEMFGFDQGREWLVSHYRLSAR